MKLLFEEITGKTRQYSINDGCWLRDEKVDCHITAATANFLVSRQESDTVFLAGKMEIQRSALCDRCGEQVKEKLYGEFEYRITTRKEEAVELRDVECSDDDAITLYVKDPEIDVDEILREQTYLSFPLRTLCSEECKGICAGCGVVLNKGGCCCSSDKSTSAFAVLKKLTNR
ncbi:MAG: DUF177 domain-containing protein [Desulforhopalus sp.]